MHLKIVNCSLSQENRPEPQTQTTVFSMTHIPRIYRSIVLMKLIELINYSNLTGAFDGNKREILLVDRV